MDGLQETQFNIFEVIRNLRVSEVVKQTMVQLVLRKKRGDEEAGKRLCKIALVLWRQGNITAEEHAMLLIVANEKGRRRKGGAWQRICAIWQRWFCLLR